MKYTLIDWHTKRVLQSENELLPLWKQFDSYTKKYKAVVVINEKNEIVAGNTIGYSYTIDLGIKNIRGIV